MQFLAEIHTKLIHFPIALLVIYPFIELLFLITKKEYFNKTAFLFLSMGVVASLFAAVSGNQAFESVAVWTDSSKNIFEQHQYYANITVWFFAALLVLRFIIFKKYSSKRIIVLIFFIVSLAGLIAIYQTGHYGGLLSKQFDIDTFELNK